MNDRTRDNYDLNQLSHPAQAVEAAPIVALRSVVSQVPFEDTMEARCTLV